jgi:hypothetical protein
MINLSHAVILSRMGAEQFPARWTTTTTLLLVAEWPRPKARERRGRTLLHESGASSGAKMNANSAQICRFRRPRFAFLTRAIPRNAESAELMLRIEMLVSAPSSCSGRALFAHATHEPAAFPAPPDRDASASVPGSQAGGELGHDVRC